MTATIHKFPVEKARRTFEQQAKEKAESMAQFYESLLVGKGPIGWSHHCEYTSDITMVLKGESCHFCGKTEDEIRNDNQT